MPSSARLREASKCIRRRVSFTPVTVAAGMRPVTTSATNSLTYAAASATGYGTRHRGSGRPGQLREVGEHRADRPVLRAEQVAHARAGPVSIAAIMPAATSRTSIRFRSASRYADRLPRQKSSIICVGGERPQSPGPTGSVGFTTTTGAPPRARWNANRSARNFDRQYGPITSRAARPDPRRSAWIAAIASGCSRCWCAARASRRPRAPRSGRGPCRGS